MTLEDIQTIARIIDNKNCALLEARIAALDNLAHGYGYESQVVYKRERKITALQLDYYHRSIAAKANQQI